MKKENNYIKDDDNFQVLIKQICNELKKRDKNKNGLMLYNSFIEVMDMFQIEYGSHIIDYLMKHCSVTEDGFVNYKNLLLIHDPSKTVRNNSECIAESINPKFIHVQDKCEDIDKSMQKKNEIIRKLYAQWDKCLLKDEEFKNKLIEANIDITPEFERALYLYGPSRSLSFANVMKTLYINNCRNRKNRNNFINKIKDEKWRKLNVDENTQCFQEPNRNPIAWEEPNIIDADNLIENVEVISKYLNGEENFNLNKEIISKDFFNNTVKNLIKNYIANKISEKEFYLYLSKLNISITQELNNLIKYHESDSNGKFKDFATIIHRCIPRNITHNLQTNVESAEVGRNNKHTNLNFTFNNFHSNNLSSDNFNDNK
ncbi:conserved Plasmodium protein, unknown function [Plasmodium gallinaceum]|uniref:Cytosolic fatty-acid binding proteins domain-containing protein n=1 Tax=Plasmodium gallinaceum TaxID=5849 RepID=A0A1J1GMN3_PLAGA|nr:conserved Plasmodium protein, unknown function [Plasmodium gallinaceum]CRG93694.1 conserved Plasmodium protein, unknown function [Plasmodium gallinaceum]